MMRHKVPEDELECDSEDKPNDTNGQSLSGRLQRPFEVDKPCVPEKEENPRQT